MGKEAISNFEMPAAAGELLAGKLKSEMRKGNSGLPGINLAAV